VWHLLQSHSRHGHDSCDRPVNFGTPSCPCALQSIISCKQAGPGIFAPTLASIRASTTREFLGAGKFRAVPARPGLATWQTRKRCESRYFSGVLISKSLRLRGPLRRCSSAMFFRRLASSGQPHLLTLQIVIARKSSSRTKSSRSIVLPNAKFGSLTGSQTGSKSARFVCPRVQSCSGIILERPTLKGDEACRLSRTTRGRQGVIETRRHCCCEIGWMLLRNGLACIISMYLGLPAMSREN
jgi:hypothetical protein